MLGVVTVGGNVHVDRATDNARRILPVAWGTRPPPPLFRGEQQAVEDAEAVHGSDGLGGGSRHYPPAAAVVEERGVAAIARLARSRPGEVTLVTLGPLTNVARLLQEDAAAAHLLREIVIMGGVFGEPGNVTPVAEFNIYADPEAAQAVCQAGLPTRWVPTNVTQRCLLRDDEVGRRLERAEPGALPRLHMAHAITDAYLRHHFEGFGERACFLHDPVAVGAVLWPELFRAEAHRVDVESFGQLTRGMTIADFRPGRHREARAPNGRICLDVEHEELVRRVMERLAS